MTAKRFVVVVNPRGGTRRGMAVLERVKPIFAAEEVELDVRVTETVGHAREIARTAKLDGCAGICVVGGDGTVHEVADGLMQRGELPLVPLGLIPAGSANTIHQHLQCTDPGEAVRRIVAGTTSPLDVARVTMGDEVVYCVDIVGWGARWHELRWWSAWREVVTRGPSGIPTATHLSGGIRGRRADPGTIGCSRPQ